MASNATEKLLKLLRRRSEFSEDLHGKIAILILSETVSNILYICVYILAAIYLRLLMRNKVAQMKAAEESSLKETLVVTKQPSKSLFWMLTRSEHTRFRPT